MALLTVVHAFADFRSGHPEIYNPGRLVDDADPVVKGRESHFEQAEVTASRLRVETATAGPGERRERSRPARKAPAKKAAAKPAKKTAAKKTAAKKAAAKTPDPAPVDPPQGDASSEVL